MSGRKTLPERIRERAWSIHRRNGHPEDCDGLCWGPTQDEQAQAAREVLGSEEEKP